MISSFIVIVRVCSLRLRAARVRLCEARATSLPALPRTESVTSDLAGNLDMSMVIWTQAEEASFEGQGMIPCSQACREGEGLPTWPEASERRPGTNLQCDAEVLQRHPARGLCADFEDKADRCSKGSLSLELLQVLEAESWYQAWFDSGKEKNKNIKTKNLASRVAEVRFLPSVGSMS